MTAKKKCRPFAGISHDVIDSAAFADLTGGAVRLLLIIARQYDGRNNGELHASHSYCRPRGIASASTLQEAVSSLIAHGFIYRTRGHGISAVNGDNTPARYALTWLSLTRNRNGLFCDGFVPNAFEKWSPEKNSGVRKTKHTPPKNCSFSEGESAETPPPKIEVSSAGKTSEETTETVAIEQVPVYVPPESRGNDDEPTQEQANGEPPRILAHVTPMPIGRIGGELNGAGSFSPINTQLMKKGAA